MTCSMTCFWDYYQAPTAERRAAVVKRYKQPSSGAAKGRSNYYVPVLRAIRNQLCPEGSVEEKIVAIREACKNPAWTDRLNEIRIESNVQVYHAFRSTFGNASAKFRSCPRLQFLGPLGLAVNLQPDLFFEQDGKLTMVKLVVNRKRRPEELIRKTLQMFHRASAAKGFALSIKNFTFLQVRTGKGFIEQEVDQNLEQDLLPVCTALVEQWTEGV